MTRTYGRSPEGTRLIQKVPRGRWSTTTFLGAMRSTGFIAPLCVDGAINGQVFKAWVEQHLVRELGPGDIVVMDNLSSHKVAGVARAIEAVGASVRYLPPYSPDLNPIELAFSKFKKLLRDGAERTTGNGQALEPMRPRARSVPRNRVPQRPPPLRLPRHLKRRRTNLPLMHIALRMPLVHHNGGAAVPNCRSKIKVPESHKNETNLGHTQRLSESLTRREHSTAAKSPLRASGGKHR